MLECWQSECSKDSLTYSRCHMLLHLGCIHWWVLLSWSFSLCFSYQNKVTQVSFYYLHVIKCMYFLHHNNMLSKSCYLFIYQYSQFLQRYNSFRKVLVIYLLIKTLSFTCVIQKKCSLRHKLHVDIFLFIWIKVRTWKICRKIVHLPPPHSFLDLIKKLLAGWILWVFSGMTSPGMKTTQVMQVVDKPGEVIPVKTELSAVWLHRDDFSVGMTLLVLSKIYLISSTL